MIDRANELVELIKWHQDAGVEERKEINSSFLAFDGKMREAFDGRLEADYLATNNIMAAPNLVSKLIRAIAVALSYGNPAMYVQPDDPDSIQYREVLTGGLRRLLRATQFPQYLRASVIKALVGKRSGWKIGWNEQTDLPDVSVVDPRMLFFDENAAIWRDCRYYIHLIEMSSREWNKRVQAGVYRDVGNVQPEAPDSKLTIVPSTLKPSYPRKVVYVYEYYDLEEGFVMHIPKDADSPCFEGPLAYNPFVMFNLDINGQDCKGSSEAVRVQRQQQNLIIAYYLLTKVMGKSIPGVIGDAEAFDEDDQEAIANSEPGDMTWARLKTKDQTKRIQDAFAQQPNAVVPDIYRTIIGAAESDATDDAAYSEIRAGKPGGFRSATEAAIADANVKSHIADKEANLNEALGRFGDLMLYVTGRYRREPLFIPPDHYAGFAQGSTENWQQLTRDVIRKAAFYCEIGLYNPTRRNPEVYAELVGQNMATVMQIPNLRKDRFLKTWVASMGYGADTVMSDEELAKKAAADAAKAQEAVAAAQGQQGAQGPQGAPPVGMGAPGGPQAGSAGLQALLAGMGGQAPEGAGGPPGVEVVPPGPPPGGVQIAPNPTG